MSRYVYHSPHTKQENCGISDLLVEYYVDCLFPLQHKNLCFDVYNCHQDTQHEKDTNWLKMSHASAVG